MVATTQSHPLNGVISQDEIALLDKFNTRVWLRFFYI